MKQFSLVCLLAIWAMSAPVAEAGVKDWPVVGQVIRVGSCVVGGAGSLVASLLSHLGQWGAELVSKVGQCALETAGEVSDVAEDVVSLEVPTPDPVTEEPVHE